MTADSFEEGFLCINGSGDVQINAFEKLADMKINGSGCVQAERMGAAKIVINGSGDITAGDVNGLAEIAVNGSGDVDMKSCLGAKVKISGSGDVNIARISGSVETRIHGSGDVSCAGEIETLKLRIQGSGDFHGAELIVGESDIKTAEGSRAEIDIGRIRGRSVEHLAKETVLRVRQRG